MANMRTEKIKIGSTILAVLEQRKEQDRQALVSSLKLESGFTDRVIQDIINDLITVGKLKSDGVLLKIR